MRKRAPNRRPKSSFTWLLTLAITACVLITGNTLVPFSPNIPTWTSLQHGWQNYAAENPAKTTVDPNEARIHFIDVGQGSCILIQQGKYAALLDGGERDQGEKIVAYLQEQQVERLDLVLASHPHADHIGGMAAVLRAFDVERLVMPDLPDTLIPTTRVYEDLLDAIEQKVITVDAAEVAKSYPLGDGMFTVLGPTGDFDDLNEMSVAMRYTYHDKAFLYTADMEHDAEAALVALEDPLSADVFALGHHGSRTSSSKELLDQIGKAKFYIIQSGADNRYGHPHEEAIARVERMGAKTLRNDQRGTIVIVFPAGDGAADLRKTEK